jgi:hypothetical protein
MCETTIDRSGNAHLGEELRQQSTALGFEHAAENVHAVVHATQRKGIDHAAGSPCFRIEGTKHHPPHART